MQKHATFLKRIYHLHTLRRSTVLSCFRMFLELAQTDEWAKVSNQAKGLATDKSLLQFLQ